MLELLAPSLPSAEEKEEEILNSIKLRAKSALPAASASHTRAKCFLFRDQQPEAVFVSRNEIRSIFLRELLESISRSARTRVHIHSSIDRYPERT